MYYIGGRSNLAFIHIPKNAGSCVLNTFNKKSSGHEALQARRRKKAGVKYFCVIRDPFDRVISAFEYLRNDGNGSRGDIVAKETYCYQGTFDEFLKCFHKERKRYFKQTHLGPQHRWCCEGNTILADIVINYNNFEKELRELHRKNNWHSLKYIPRVRPSPRKDINFYISEKNKEIVKEIYADDYIIFSQWNEQWI